jgi:hypothetical protein
MGLPLLLQNRIVPSVSRNLGKPPGPAGVGLAAIRVRASAAQNPCFRLLNVFSMAATDIGDGAK